MPPVSFIDSHLKTKVEYDSWLSSLAESPAEPEDLLYRAMDAVDKFALRVQEAMDAELAPYFQVLATEYASGAIPQKVK